MILLSNITMIVFADEFQLLSSQNNIEDSTETQLDSLPTKHHDSDKSIFISPTSGSIKTIYKNEEHSNSLEITNKPWPTGALIRSAIIPGWGQLYNGKYMSFVVYAGLELYFANEVRRYWIKMNKNQNHFQNPAGTTSLTGGFRDSSPSDFQFYQDNPDYQALEFDLYKKNRDKRNLYMWLTSLTLFISMFDAYVDAHMAGFDQQDKVFEVNVMPENDMIELTLTYNF